LWIEHPRAFDVNNRTEFKYFFRTKMRLGVAKGGATQKLLLHSEGQIAKGVDCKFLMIRCWGPIGRSEPDHKKSPGM